MARREIPAHWKDLMDRRGIASVRKLAERAGLSHTPVVGIVYGDAVNPTEETLAKLARALDIPLADIYWMVGRPVPHVEHWTPPAEANRMTLRQRAAIEELIRTIVDPGEAAPSTPAPGQDNVRRLHPERDNLDVAADNGHGPSEGQQQWDMLDGLGEESQDPGDRPS